MQLQDFMKDKSVCIVGPSNCLDRPAYRNYGKYIEEAFDVVVRVNKCPRDNYRGFRTDLVYIGVDIAIPIARKIKKEQGCPVISVYNYYIQSCRDLVDYSIYNFAHKLNKTYKTRFNTGTVALLHLLTFDIKQLYMTGFDFFRTDYTESSKHESSKNLKELKKYFFTVNDRSQRHDPDFQYNFFKYHILKNDHRIRIDPHLQRLIQNPRNDSFFRDYE
tara:strand:+ start:62 stop:715 length:654 start_codon:yes stop_codon:yes gene_type:complete